MGCLSHGSSLIFQQTEHFFPDDFFVTTSTSLIVEHKCPVVEQSPNISQTSVVVVVVVVLVIVVAVGCYGGCLACCCGCCNSGWLVVMVVV